MPFDPDAFLAKYGQQTEPPQGQGEPSTPPPAAAPGGFDPDAFLKKYGAAPSTEAKKEESGPGMLDTGIDVAKSLGTGVVKGTTGLIGMPNDVGNLMAAGSDLGQYLFW
jgi:hypothetical protein